MIVLDTNVVSEMMVSTPNLQVLRWMNRQPAPSIWITSVNIYEIRAGLHTGEVQIFGDTYSGLGVHIGARVGAQAGPGEVLVSRTVVDLVVGSGITFTERGEHELKGVPGRWKLFSVV